MDGHRVGNMQLGFALAYLTFCGTLSLAQVSLPEAPQPLSTGQINVNWFYGSYVPKQVSLQPLNSSQRLDLYLRRTYTDRGIYIKTALFTLRDQSENAYPEWGDGFNGFSKRLAIRQGEFIVQNSAISLGDGLLAWEPRYDRCRCTGFWPRTRHALWRNFVTYDGAEKNLRPQIFPYLGAFTGRSITTSWTPGGAQWQIKGYQAVITQVPIGMAINWIAEFAPEIGRVLKTHKIH